MMHPNYPDAFKIWGWKTEALFDVWSFEHLIMGIGLAEIAPFVRRWLFRHHPAPPADAALRVEFVIALTFCFAWEMIEHYLEAGAGPGGDATARWGALARAGAITTAIAR